MLPRVILPVGPTKMIPPFPEQIAYGQSDNGLVIHPMKQEITGAILGKLSKGARK
jgi:uncharacterized protein (UPF0218 family)